MDCTAVLELLSLQQFRSNKEGLLRGLQWGTGIGEVVDMAWCPKPCRDSWEASEDSGVQTLVAMACC